MAAKQAKRREQAPVEVGLDVPEQVERQAARLRLAADLLPRSADFLRQRDLCPCQTEPIIIVLPLSCCSAEHGIVCDLRLLVFTGWRTRLAVGKQWLF